jgi:hypothetical protein
MDARLRPFQISLCTLLILLGIAPPMISLVWFAWRLILLLSLFIAVIWLWVNGGSCPCCS